METQSSALQMSQSTGRLAPRAWFQSLLAGEYANDDPPCSQHIEDCT